MQHMLNFSSPAAPKRRFVSVAWAAAWRPHKCSSPAARKEMCKGFLRLRRQKKNRLRRRLVQFNYYAFYGGGGRFSLYFLYGIFFIIFIWDFLYNFVYGIFFIIFIWDFLCMWPKDGSPVRSGPLLIKRGF